MPSHSSATSRRPWQLGQGCLETVQPTEFPSSNLSVARCDLQRPQTEPSNFDCSRDVSPCLFGRSSQEDFGFEAHDSAMLLKVSNQLVRFETSCSANQESIRKIIQDTQNIMMTTLQCVVDMKAAVATSLQMRLDEPCAPVAEEGLRVSADSSPRGVLNEVPAANQACVSAPRSTVLSPDNACVVLPEHANPEELFDVCTPTLQLAMHASSRQPHDESFRIPQPVNQNHVDKVKGPLEELAEMCKAALQNSCETIEKETKNHIAAMQSHLKRLAPMPSHFHLHKEEADHGLPVSPEQHEENPDDDCTATPIDRVCTLATIHCIHSGSHRTTQVQRLELVQQLAAHLNRPFCQRIVESAPYHLVMLCFVAMQSICLGVEMELKMEHYSDVYHTSSSISEVPRMYWYNFVLNSIFLADLVAQMFAWKWQFFLTSDYEALAWNVYDTCVVALSVFDYFENITINANVGILRCLRLFRAVRIIRLIAFFSELKKMLSTFLSGCVHLIWIALLLFIFLYVFALVFMQQATHNLEEMGAVKLQTLRNLTVTTDKYPEMNNVIPMIYLYSSIKVLMLNLFASITGGLEWMYVLHPLIESSDIYYCLSLAYVLFLIVGFLSVVTGMFVDQAAVQIANTEAKLAQKRRLLEEQSVLQRSLELIDAGQEADENTEIDAQQMAQILDDKHIQDWLFGNGVDTNRDFGHVIAMLAPTDADVCSLQRFLTTLRHLSGNALSFDLSVLTFECRRAFDLSLAYNRHQYHDMRRVMNGINNLHKKHNVEV